MQPRNAHRPSAAVLLIVVVLAATVAAVTVGSAGPPASAAASLGPAAPRETSNGWQRIENRPTPPVRTPAPLAARLRSVAVAPLLESTPTPTPTSLPTETPTPSQTPTATPTATWTPDQSTGSLDVFAYFDINLNGKAEQGETPLGGAGYRISQDETPVATGATGADGHALFTNLVPGAYRVDETTPPAGYIANRSSLFVEVVGGRKSTLPFSYRMSTQTPQPTATPTATPPGQVWKTWLPLLVR